jgi:hypothetical protein
MTSSAVLPVADHETNTEKTDQETGEKHVLYGNVS